MSRIGNTTIHDDKKTLAGRRMWPPEAYDAHPTADVFYWDAVLDCAGRCQHGGLCQEGCCSAYSCPAANAVKLVPCKTHEELLEDKRRKWWSPPIGCDPPMVGDAPPEAEVVVT